MTLEIFASQLSLGTGGDDVARVHQAMQALGRSVRSPKQRAGTVAVLKGLQTESGVQFPASTM